MRIRALVTVAVILAVGVALFSAVRSPGPGSVEQRQAAAKPAVRAARVAEIPASERTAVARKSNLKPQAKAMLARNGFVVVPARAWGRAQLVDVYGACKGERFPIFVTSDSMLHVSHLVFDFYLKFLESAHLRSDMLNLSDAVLSASMAQWDEAKSSRLKDAALTDAAFFFIGKALLIGRENMPTRDIPQPLRKNVDAELQLIEKHAGFAHSPLFGYREDYSQYVPRGHYSRSPEFARYFKAMMWYGRMAMRLYPSSETSEQAARMQTLQAILACKALNQGRAKGEQALKIWRRINETTAFFAGRSDDITAAQYLPLAQRVFGRTLPLAAISNENNLGEFIRQARELEPPRILSAFAVWREKPGWQRATMGFRFMGQRFSLDAHAMNQLVFDRVREYTGGSPQPFTWTNAQGMQVRGFPLGLDLLCVMGSKEAENIIHQNGDDRYEGYAQQVGKLREAFSAEKDWTSDQSRGRLNCLRRLAAAPDPRCPPFMKGQPWARKQLLAALGSWTELRHDTILYTKQPYSESQAMFSTMSKGGPPQPKPLPVHGYVEPSPQVYRCLRDLLEQLKSQLDSLGFPPDRALESNLSRFAGTLARLEGIAARELNGEAITQTDQNLIENIGMELRYVLRFAHYVDVTAKFRTEMDLAMPIIADVHTDVNSRMVLEEAVGAPFLLYAVVSVDGKPTLCKGPVYSHYEFKQPTRDRLTDEAWRSMLDAGKAPHAAAWTAEFIAPQAE